MKRIIRLITIFGMLSVLLLGFNNAISVVRAENSEDTDIDLSNNASVYSGLQDSTFYEYPTWCACYNCYAYALELYNKQENKNYAYNIGYFSDQEIPQDKYNAQILSGFVKDDLEALGCYDISVTTDRPYDLSDNEKLICLRTGERFVNNKLETKYHFMRYNPEDGYWYHKPGGMSILRYNYEPSFNRKWTDEAINMSTVYSPPTMQYDSEIYYIRYKESAHFNPETNFFEINSYKGLKVLHNLSLKNFQLTANITIPTSDPWIPIEDFIDKTLDGNGYSINNLKLILDKPDKTEIGFIRRSHGATIQNLTFGSVEIRMNNSAVSFTREISIGTIAGKMDGGMIENCKVGSLRIYSEAHLASNVYANMGGIVGVNSGTINNSSVNYCGISGLGNISGIAGKNTSNISNCMVNNSSISLYYGTAGGIVGKNENAVEGCEVNNTTISCYNGYPSDLPQCYPSEHNAMIGGICGWNTGIIRNVENEDNPSYIVVNNSTISYAGGTTDSHLFAPEMGLLCGRSNNSVSGTVTETSVDKGDLRVITWKGGFLNLVTYSWDQGKFAGNREIGREE